MSRPTTLVLFDIDGTLCHTGGAGGRAVAEAFKEVYGKPIDPEAIDFRGRTDISLWREMLGTHGLVYRADDPRLSVFKKKYIEHLRTLLQTANPRQLPGVQPLLEKLAGTPSVALGLLTGNIEDGGRTKLQAVDLNRYFPVGGFGEDGEDRVDIAVAAVRRAKEFYRVDFAPDHIFVVGDAEADILAARGANAKSVAVSSGWTAKEDLMRLKPDVFMDGLEQTANFLRAIGIHDPATRSN